MSPAHPDVNFRTIRHWDGSQHRAFEELCYQLLREPQDLPAGNPDPIRTGNPDGGVEWYVQLLDGTQWGWQAKYYFDENLKGMLDAMTESVRRVVAERPNLRRLTFCIPFNLSTGTAAGRRQPARQRYENRVRQWQQRIAGAEQIDFRSPIQGSDLLDRLALSTHAGRRLFWFDDTVFSSERLEQAHAEATARAGRRYRPELQVDIPIEDDLRALGFSDSYLQTLERHRIPFVKTFLRYGLLAKHSDPRSAVLSTPHQVAASACASTSEASNSFHLARIN